MRAGPTRWVTAIGLRQEAYGTHSIRRRKASMIYKAAGEIRAIQILPGHSKSGNTVRYLGVDVDASLNHRHRIGHAIERPLQLFFGMPRGARERRLRIRVHPAGRDIGPAAFALGWVLNNRLVTSAIAGSRLEEPWDGYVRALDDPFAAQDEALVEELVAPGQTSTPGYLDPVHPVEGRVPQVGARRNRGRG